MSFNRPQFLKPVLTSIIHQGSDIVDGREVHLFQDGAVNKYSRIRYAKDADIEKSIEAFQESFPGGTVHNSAHNIGIFENFKRAEEYVFVERRFDCAYFFEDDLILSTRYLEAMDGIRRWGDHAGNVSYFAAYGNHYATEQEQQEHQHELMALDHHWAFGLYRTHWQAMQPLLKPYESVVYGMDYSRRDHRKVFALYDASEISPRASSQDAAKAIASQRLNLWRCNTVVTYAKYIGTTGQHMTPELFKELGFDKTVVRQTLADIHFPSAQDIMRRIAEQAELFKTIREQELGSIISKLPARQYNALRFCDRSDVTYGYRLFLKREPESEEVIERRARKQSVLDFVAELVRSEEFNKLGGQAGAGVATRQDVSYAYRLCLHRDPDDESVYQTHVGKSDARMLTLQLWNCDERKQLWGRIEVPSANI